MKGMDISVMNGGQAYSAMAQALTFAVAEILIRSFIAQEPEYHLGMWALSTRFSSIVEAWALIHPAETGAQCLV